MTREAATIEVQKTGEPEVACLDAKIAEPCALVIFGITGDLAAGS